MPYGFKLEPRGSTGFRITLVDAAGNDVPNSTLLSLHAGRVELFSGLPPEAVQELGLRLDDHGHLLTRRV